jgi:hypothetical protein
MIAFQWALRMGVVSIWLAAALVEAKSQAADNQRLDTLADVAKAIAHAIDATTVRSPGAPVAFDSAAAHDNVVEVKYVVNDLPAFARFKSSSNQARAALVGYFCNDSERVAVLRQGVVMDYAYVRSDNSDRVEFTIDKSSCDTR